MSIPVFQRIAQITGAASALRRGCGVVVLAAIAAIAVGGPLAAPPPAAAIQGLELYTDSWGATDDWPTKTARAECLDGKRLVGGGGAIVGRADVRLTGLIPDKGGFRVYAQAPSLTHAGDWSVDAYAICAKPSELANYQIVADKDDPNSSAQFQQTAAVCPAGTVAYSAGANIESPNGHVGLQLSRTSGPQDIARATAREDQGHTGTWEVRSYAVCAVPKLYAGIHVEGTIAPGAEAKHRCGGSYEVHGPGGGGGLTDGGAAWLRQISPDSLLKEVSVKTTAPLVGGMVAHTTCAL